jgi:hypothetical protein
MQVSCSDFQLIKLVQTREHSCAPVATDSVSAVYRDPKKNWKSKKHTVQKFQNVRQTRTGRNVVKSSSPIALSSWLIFDPVLTLPRRTCHHSASSVLAVRIRYRVIAVGVCVCVQITFIYQLNFTVFMFVTRISRYTVYSFRYYPRFKVNAVGLGTKCTTFGTHCITIHGAKK